MTIEALIYTLNGEVLPEFRDVDRVSYVNAESYGPGAKVGDVQIDGDEARVLVLNVNGISAVRFDIQED